MQILLDLAADLQIMGDTDNSDCDDELEAVKLSVSYKNTS